MLAKLYLGELLLIQRVKTNQQYPALARYLFEAVNDRIKIWNLEIRVVSIPKCGSIKKDACFFWDTKMVVDFFYQIIIMLEKGVVAWNATFIDFSVIPKGIVNDIRELTTARKHQIGFFGVCLRLQDI